MFPATSVTTEATWSAPVVSPSLAMRRSANAAVAAFWSPLLTASLSFFIASSAAPSTSAIGLKANWPAAITLVSTPALTLSTASSEANEIAVRSTGSMRVWTIVIFDCLPAARSSSGAVGNDTMTSTLPSCSCCIAAASSDVIPTSST